MGMIVAMTVICAAMSTAEGRTEARAKLRPYSRTLGIIAIALWVVALF